MQMQVSVCAGSVCLGKCLLPALVSLRASSFSEQCLCSLAFWHLSLPPTSIKDMKWYGIVHRCSIKNFEAASVISVISMRTVQLRL